MSSSAYLSGRSVRDDIHIVYLGTGFNEPYVNRLNCCYASVYSNLRSVAGNGFFSPAVTHPAL